MSNEQECIGGTFDIEGQAHCDQFSVEGWCCTLCVGHTGRHVAIANEPYEVMSTWNADE